MDTLPHAEYRLGRQSAGFGVLLPVDKEVIAGVYLRHVLQQLETSASVLWVDLNVLPMLKVEQGKKGKKSRSSRLADIIAWRPLSTPGLIQPCACPEQLQPISAHNDIAITCRNVVKQAVE